MLIPHPRQLGFTLVELMIGVVILGILFSIAAPNFSIWTQNSQIRTAAESISAGLQFARAEAVRRNTNITFQLNGTENVDSTWAVGCTTPDESLNAASEVRCATVIQSHSGAEGTQNALVSANIEDVTFNGLGRASNATTGNAMTVTAMTINISNPIGGECQINNGPMRCLNILVATGGQVRMCNPSMPSDNPQGC